jgi:hypothetical protein
VDEDEDDGQQQRHHPQMTPALVITGTPPQAQTPIPGFSGPFTPSLLSHRPWSSHVSRNVVLEIQRYFPHQSSQEQFCWSYAVLSPGTSS